MKKHSVKPKPGKKSPHKKRHPGRVLLILFLLLVLTVGCSLLLSKYGLMVTRYRISNEKLEKGFRVLQLSDLHNTRFGKNQSRLLRKVRREQPDLILLTGDLLNRDADEEELEMVAKLISSLCETAPVYLSYGNHELAYIADRKSGEDPLRKAFSDAGAAVLDTEYLDIEVNGQPIRIGGASSYCKPDLYLHERITEKEAAEREMLDLMQSTAYDGGTPEAPFTLLLCHMPYCWIRDNGLSEWEIDAVFAGHTHGGQLRFPFLAAAKPSPKNPNRMISVFKKGQISNSPDDLAFPYTGGIWAPDHGWFPGSLSGVYRSKDGKKCLILSRGLGTVEKIPRFNNVPEIVVTDFAP